MDSTIIHLSFGNRFQLYRGSRLHSIYSIPVSTDQPGAPPFLIGIDISEVFGAQMGLKELARYLWEDCFRVEAYKVLGGCVDIRVSPAEKVRFMDAALAAINVYKERLDLEKQQAYQGNLRR